MAPVQIDIVPLIVAILGSGGVGAAAIKLIDGVLKIRAGMSARESKRRVDIIQQRDEAIAFGEGETTKRRIAQEYAARLRRRLIENGIEPDPEPVYEKTIPKAQLQKLRDEE